MAWKQTPMTWEWFQEECLHHELADTCAKLAKARYVVKFIVGPIGDDPIGNSIFTIVSCKGTAVKAKKKRAEAAAESDE